MSQPEYMSSDQASSGYADVEVTKESHGPILDAVTRAELLIGETNEALAVLRKCLDVVLVPEEDRATPDRLGAARIARSPLANRLESLGDELEGLRDRIRDTAERVELPGC